jgi:hypothetical protein
VTSTTGHLLAPALAELNTAQHFQRERATSDEGFDVMQFNAAAIAGSKRIASSLFDVFSTLDTPNNQWDLWLEYKPDPAPSRCQWSVARRRA